MKEANTFLAIVKMSPKIEKRILSRMSADWRDHAMGDFIRGGDYRANIFVRLSRYRHIDRIISRVFYVQEAIEAATKNI